MINALIERIAKRVVDMLMERIERDRVERSEKLRRQLDEAFSEVERAYFRGERGAN